MPRPVACAILFRGCFLSRSHKMSSDGDYRIEMKAKVATLPAGESTFRVSTPAGGHSTNDVSQSSPTTTAEPVEFRFLNRELTWLAFNRRVLAEAEDERNPLLERVKFLAITASNLDEFFMKHIGGLKQQAASGVRALTL